MEERETLTRYSVSGTVPSPRRSAFAPVLTGTAHGALTGWRCGACPCISRIMRCNLILAAVSRVGQEVLKVVIKSRVDEITLLRGGGGAAAEPLVGAEVDR